MGRRIWVGCCGFARKLEEYARHLPVVEVQQTFYRLPQVRTAQGWRRRVPEGFVFTLKAWQLITHPPTSPTYRRLGRPVPASQADRYGFFAPTEEVREAWAQTLEVARALRASVVVFQCPASFTPTSVHVANLERFFRTAPRDGLQFAWEPRGDWPGELVRRLCQELDLVHCTDPFVARSVFGHFRYYRLHGRGGYRYRYTEEDLRELRGWCQEPAYVLFNNVSMWEDALRFQELLGSDGHP
ncbi:MAG: DUF72 domain-containing protein [Armatimonadota bacterium]|nr:DUF72 domain-containing protein [Armatimonadota bacterium]